MLKEKKIKSAITLTFILLGLLPIFILGSFIVLILNKHLSTDIKKENVVVVNSIANQTEDFLNTPLLVLEQIKNVIEDKSLIKPADFNKFLDSYIYKYSFFESIIFLDKNGKIINLAPYKRDLVNIDYSDDIAFNKVKYQTPFWSSVFISQNTGEPTLTLAINFNNGVLYGNLSLKKLSSLLETKNLSPNVFAGIIDENGIFIAHTDLNKVNQREQEPLKNLIKNNLKNGGSYTTVQKDNENFIISYSSIKPTGWIIIVYQKEEIAFKSVNTIINVFIAGLILSLVIILIISVYGYRSVINPISKIISLTKEISDGNYSRKISLNSYSEINSLAESLNKMSNAIKSREEELITRQKNLKQAAKLANLGYWVWNRDTGRLKFSVDALDIMKLDTNDLTPEELSQHIFVEDKEKFLSALNNSIDNNAQLDITFRYIKPDKMTGYFFSQAESVTDTDGSVISMIGVVQDITTQKLNENKLQELLRREAESSRLKDSLLANINHELRTPMNGIMGLALILAEKNKNTETEHILENILISSKRLMTTLNSIIDISELESNQYSLKVSPFNLLQQTELYLREYVSIAAEKNIFFKIDCSEKDITAFTDPVLYKKIILNIVDNAFKYTEKGSVKIIIKKENVDNKKFIAISVEDTGIGIDEKNFEIIFEEFRQISEGYGRKFEGNGLGLALVKKMTKLIGGEIRLKSSIGIGSNFTLLIPSTDIKVLYGKDFGESAEHLKIGTENKDTDKKISVLYVEDNAINKQVVFSYLRDKFDLSHSFTGEKAIQLVKTKKIDLILMDINLGTGIDGVETLKQIRMLDGYSDIPAIAITGYAMSSDQDRFLKLGFSGYLAKPFNKESLLDSISTIKIALNY